MNVWQSRADTAIGPATALTPSTPGTERLGYESNLQNPSQKLYLAKKKNVIVFYFQAINLIIIFSG